MNLGLFSIVGYIHLIFAGRVVGFCHGQQTFSYHWSNIYFHQVLLGGQAWPISQKNSLVPNRNLLSARASILFWIVFLGCFLVAFSCGVFLFLDGFS